MKSNAAYEKLKQLRTQEPFIPFLIKNEAGQEADVTERFAFAFTDSKGCAYASDGRWIRYRLDTVQIRELEQAVA